MSENSPESTDPLWSKDLSESERHRLFEADRRRLALDILAGQTTPVELDELAAGIASREDLGTAVDDIERVAITLHHNHLPKLDDAGVLAYDPDAQLVTPNGDSQYSTRGNGVLTP